MKTRKPAMVTQSLRPTPFLHPTLVAALLAATVLAGSSLAVRAQPVAKTDAPLTTLLSSHPGMSPAANASVPVILKLDGALTPARRAQLTGLGVTLTQDLSFIHDVAVTVPESRLTAVSALAFVTHLSSDGTVKKCDTFTVGSSGAATAMQQYNVSGAGVGVAVIDSGVRNLPDLSIPGGGQRILQSVSFVPGDTSTDDACGHGSHVAGIIAGNGLMSTGSQFFKTFYGIARSANIINLRALDATGQACVSTVISAIQYAVTNKSKDNIRVINLSLGHPVGESYTTDPLCQACEAAWKAGIVVVCAAGNEGRLNTIQATGAANEGWGAAYGSIQSPGNDPYVITVGATKSMDGNRAHDQIATYSSRGPSRLDLVLKPDIIAPGNKVISLYAYGSSLYLWNSATGNGLPEQSYESTVDPLASTDYFVLSGTSMASPVVAGAVALMLQATPSLTPDTVKARLMASADKWLSPTGSADPCTYGAGYLNIPAAMASKVTVSQSALSPKLYQDASGNTYISTSVIGSRSIWGSASLTDMRSIWGSSSLASSSTGQIAGSRSIWGSTSVWTDRSIWGSSTSAVDLSSIALYGE